MKKNRIIRKIEKGKIEFYEIEILNSLYKYSQGESITEKNKRRIREICGEYAYRRPDLFICEFLGYLYEIVSEEHTEFQTYAIVQSIYNLGGNLDWLLGSHVDNIDNINEVMKRIKQ